MSSVTPLEVTSAHGRYDVRIEDGLLRRLGAEVAPLLSGRRVALVTDENVAGLYAGDAARSMADAGLRVDVLRIPAGERSKTWETAGGLLESLAAAAFGRDSAVVALGGGVVGDLAGFVAATYLRGVPVVQVPTTLLAQVDSAIGGKTGVDLPQGKNLAGAFWPPRAVIADTGCLRTLSDLEWASGLGEVAKSAVLDGEDSMSALEASADALAARDGAAVIGAVRMSAGLKVRFVSADEREDGPREALNYGHTLGHAIERTAGYGAVAHGVAVAEGIRFAAIVAEIVLGASPEWTERQASLFDSLGLTRMKGAWPAEKLTAAMYADKKVRDGKVRMVLTDRPGSWVTKAVEADVLERAFARGMV